MTISALLIKKQKQLKLSTYQLAKKLRISLVSVQRVLAASSQPNVRTAGKYAKFLGLSLKALEKKLGPGKPRGRAAAKPAKRAARKAARR